MVQIETMQAQNQRLMSHCNALERQKSMLLSQVGQDPAPRSVPVSSLSRCSRNVSGALKGKACKHVIACSGRCANVSCGQRQKEEVVLDHAHQESTNPGALHLGMPGMCKRQQ